MKAIVYTHYGPPDVLQFKEVEKPTPRAGQILVKIYAASANPLDWHLMRASPFIARLAGGLGRPKDPRLGADFAGRCSHWRWWINQPASPSRFGAGFLLFCSPERPSLPRARSI